MVRSKSFEMRLQDIVLTSDMPMKVISEKNQQEIQHIDARIVTMGRLRQAGTFHGHSHNPGYQGQKTT